MYFLLDSSDEKSGEKTNDDAPVIDAETAEPKDDTCETNEIKETKKTEEIEVGENGGGKVAPDVCDVEWEFLDDVKDENKNNSTSSADNNDVSNIVKEVTEIGKEPTTRVITVEKVQTPVIDTNSISDEVEQQKGRFTITTSNEDSENGTVTFFFNYEQLQ